MERALLDTLNGIFAPLRDRAVRLTRALNQAGVAAQWSWYGGHSVLADGEYRTEEFPIPVVEAAGLCDVGFDPGGCWLEFQLARAQALAFDWLQLPPEAEVYGAEDYLHDFFRPGMDPAGTAGRIARSAEQTVNVALTFPPDGPEDALLAAVRQCRRWKSDPPHTTGKGDDPHGPEF